MQLEFYVISKFLFYINDKKSNFIVIRKLQYSSYISLRCDYLLQLLQLRIIVQCKFIC